MKAIINKTINLAVIKDEQVFKDLYKKYFVKLYRFSASIVQASEPAEEIVHDVLMKLWKKRDSFTEIENLDTYLYVSVKNLSLNYLRDERKYESADIEELFNSTSYISIDPESLMISEEKIKLLNDCINVLPSRCK